MKLLSVEHPENIVSRLSHLIGKTPMFQLGRTCSGSRLLIKLERCNPTGSAKVRMARQMVLEAERDGSLRPGGVIVEPTSGNTGLGLALIAIERGYQFVAVVDKHASKDKLRAMSAMGAELVFVEGEGPGPHTLERRRVAAEIAEARGGVRLDQHNHSGNPNGYRHIAHELLSDLEGDVDYLVCAVGTGGAISGTSRELRRLGSKARVIGVEPLGSIIFGGPGGRYWQSGAGSPPGFAVGRNVDYSVIDEGVQVDDREAFATARAVAKRTGLLLGGTAGAAIYAALRRLADVEPGATLVAIACDAGEKYLDTLYDDVWMRERELLAPEIEFEMAELIDRCCPHNPDGLDLIDLEFESAMQC